jgi:signal transduction histidine kinase
VSERVAGLRLQIALALIGLLTLAFVPLYLAVASLSRATLIGVSEGSAEAVAHTLGSALLSDGDASSLREVNAEGGALARFVGEAVPDVCMTRGANGAAGGGIACASCATCNGEGASALRAMLGSIAADVTADVTADVRADAPPRATRVRTQAIRPIDAGTFDVVVASGSTRLGARIRSTDVTSRARPLLRLVALYMGFFAIALVVFASFALTRLIVRPVDALARAAMRVAAGARTLDVESTGAAELADLAKSLRTMTARLVADEAAMRAQVEALSETTRRLTEARALVARSERLASVGTLAAGFAHEVGNPLAALAGLVDLLEAGGLSAEEERDFLARIKRETERLQAIVRKLLDFARPEASASDAATSVAGAPRGEAPAAAPKGPREPVSASHADVRAVASDVLALLRPQKNFAGVRLEASLPEAANVAMPSAHLAQVLLNVLLNAADAVQTRKSDAPARIALEAVDEGPYVRIAVSDNGPGVAPEVRARVFEPFVTTKEVGAGTGLGLAVCRGLVEEVGGRIELDVTYTEGARIVMRLPRAAVAKPA